MAHVKPRQGVDLLGRAKGAYVVSVALTSGIRSFAELVTKELEVLGFEVLELEDIEPLDDRLRSGQPEPGLIRLARCVGPTHPVVLGTFDAYLDD